MNDRYAYFLVGLVLLIAVPQASFPAVWWLLFSFAICAAAVYHLLRGARLAPSRALQLTHHKGLLSLVLLVPAVALLQTLPIAGILPAALTWLPDTVGLIDPPATISLAPTVSTLGALRVLIYVVFFAMIVEVAGQDSRAGKMGWLLFFGILAHALWAMIALNVLSDITIWGEKTAYLGAASGTFVNRNSFATFLGFGLVLGIALVIERARKPRIRNPRGRSLLSPDNIEIVALTGLCLLLAITIVATQSRLGLVATLAGVFTTVTAVRLKSNVSGGRVLAEAAAVLALLMIVGLLGGGVGLIERSIFLAGNTEVRFDIYAQALSMIAERPFLGWGAGAFAPAFELTREPGLSTAGIIHLGHSTYLTNWVELGLIFGSIAIVAGVAVGWTLLRRLARRSTNIAMPAAALGVLVLGAVHSAMDFSLEIPANMFLFIAIIGMGIASRRRVDQSGDS
jgi:O-antigen ligase